MQASPRNNNNRDRVAVPSLGVIVELSTGRVIDARSGEWCRTWYDHKKGATVLVDVPFNLDHGFFHETTLRLNRLVCFCQHGRPEDPSWGAYHLNGEWKDNRGINLVWDSGQIAARNAVINQKQPTKLFPHLGTIRAILATGYENFDAIAETFHVHPGSIHNLRRGKTWSYIQTPDVNEHTEIADAVHDRLLYYAAKWDKEDRILEEQGIFI